MDGVINIYKEKGYTSHDVVAKMRGILKQRKIGHTGTLDPDATGVLPVCIGKATKLCDTLTDKRKTYRTTFLLGKITDTQDISGTVLHEASAEQLESISEKQVRDAIMSFEGIYEQIPPMYSALKVNGKRLYELARAGVEIERKARSVELYSIIISAINLQGGTPEITMEVSCSKGTYIRTLCYDIGEKLGVGATMKTLVRTQVDRFLLQDALYLSQVEQLRDAGSLEQYIIPIDEMFHTYSKIMLHENWDKPLHNGNRIPLEATDVEIEQGEQIRVYDSENHFIGVYEKTSVCFSPVKIFFA